MSNADKSKTEKKRLRISSSTSAEDDEEGAAIAHLLERITKIEQQAVKREAHIAQLETQLTEANSEINSLSPALTTFNARSNLPRKIRQMPSTA